MKYTSTVLAVLASSALAYTPAEPKCEVVTVTKYGQYIWKPTPAVWDDVPAESTTTTKNPWEDVPAESTTSKDPWGDVPAESTTTTTDPWSDIPAESTTTTDPWSDIPAESTTSTDPWGDVTTTTTTSEKPHKPTTTTTTTEKPHTPTTFTTSAHSTTDKPKPSTTTSVPAPKATCPSDNKKNVLAGGSCGCSFQINCATQTNPTADSKFWQAVPGQKVGSLAECNALCDANTLCTATLFVDEPSSKDYLLCFQTSGLPAPAGAGYAQISYKGTCSGKCTESYNAPK